MIYPSAITLRCDRVQRDIAQAIDYASAIDQAADADGKVDILMTEGGMQMRSSEIRASAREVGIEHIIACMSPEYRHAAKPTELNVSLFALIRAGVE